MNLREVREAAERIDASNVKDVDIVCQHIFATIDPEPESPITADWLREVWGWSSYGTMSMHYDHDEYTAFSWRQEDGLSFVAKSHQMRCYTTGFPVATRQQFCDLARCLEIPRQKAKLEQSNESYCGKCGEKLKQTKKGVQYCECWMPTLGEDGAK